LEVFDDVQSLDVGDGDLLIAEPVPEVAQVDGVRG
jgi:hypothetical protein